MNNKTLGTIALIGAPTMFLGTWAENAFPSLADSWFTGVWGILYITAYMCSIAGIKQARVLGSSKLGKAMPVILLVTLSLANIDNLVWLFAAKNKPAFFMVIDLFWPLSHVLMLAVGMLAISAAKLAGWKRYIPLLMGLWLPFALTVLSILGRTQASLIIGGLYNAVVVILLALIVRNLPEQQPTSNEHPKLTPVLQ